MSRRSSTVLAKRSAPALPVSAPAASKKLREDGLAGKGLALRPKPLLIAGVMLIVSAVSCNRQIATNPDVWAVVNNKDILRGDVEKVYRTNLNQHRGTDNDPGPAPSQEEA